MRKVTSIIMLFVMGLNMVNPVLINAKQIDNKIENKGSEKIKGNKSSLAPTDVVNIPDVNLKKGLNSIFKQPADSNITVAQMESLDKIYLQGKKIKDLTGLEFATNADVLYLSKNQISDLSPLSGLVNISQLELNNNQISDLSPLSGLVNLESMSLELNQISDISPLNGLVSLKVVKLDDNQISDLSPLSGLMNLQGLWLDDNQISDLSPLSGLVNISQLWLNNNQVSDITPLSGLTKLWNLELSNNKVKDITPLSKLTAMSQMDLDHNQISDITPLSNLNLLIRADLRNNEIEDISPLAGHKNITTMFLMNNHISDFSSLGKFFTTHIMFNPSNQIINIDLGTFANKGDIPKVYKLPIKEGDGITEHEVSIDLNNIVEGKNTFTQSYDFAPSSSYSTHYTGVVNLELVYSPSASNEKPVIDGTDDVTLDVNDTFDPMAGVSAVDKEDGDLTSEINVFTKNHREDKLTEGEYIYYYSVTDSAGAESKVERKVTVTSAATNEKPVIDGINDVTLNVNDSFDPMQGVSATDKEDGDLTSKLTITDNNLDITKVGSYKITYSVTDSDGNKTDGSRNIKVVDNSTNKPGDGGDITPMKPGTGDKDNTLSKTGSNMLVISFSAIAALLLIKKSYKL